MHKKTSTIVGLAIATILTTYLSALTLSNQAFAQIHFGPGPGSGEDSLVGIHPNQVLSGEEAQIGKILSGDLLAKEHIPLTPLTPPPGLGCSPLDPRC